MPIIESSTTFQSTGHAAVFVLAWGVLQLFALLPRSLAYRVADVLAWTYFHAVKRHRRIAERNLKLAFPESSAAWRRDTAMACYRQIGDLVVEISKLGGLTRQSVAERIQYEDGYGVEHYLEARRAGRPVLFLTAHVSAWEVLPCAHGLLTHPLSFVIRPLDNPYLERYLRRLRERCGNRCIPKRNSAREVLRALNSSEDLGILIDQNVNDEDRIFVDFFGIPAATTSAPALFALRTSAAVIPGFLVPGERRGQYRIRFYPPVQLVRTGDNRSDILANTQVFTRYVEDVVREFPHTWLWGHRRWKTRPPGDTRDLYEGL